jgi:Tfp pilus assembly protein PilX
MGINWLTQGASLPVLLVVAVLALLAIFGFILQSRASAARRLHALLDAYAEREIRQGPEQAKRTYPRRNLHARPQSQNR